MDRQKAAQINPRLSVSTLSVTSTSSAGAGSTGAIDSPTLEMTVVVPAYNEEARLEIMLEEAVAFLDEHYTRTSDLVLEAKQLPRSSRRSPGMGGYEILLVDDGSSDRTVEVALNFSMRHGLHDVLRVISLRQNRGKGGAVTHGFRHARGEYVCFADADGASRFSDIEKLVQGCEGVLDRDGRGVAVGSRAHLVASEAVVKRSRLRNALMHSFHLILRLATTRETARIRDTQCGFKLFSRAALPFIIPYMHAEGWIFDVEMLMLAESSPACTASSDQDEDERCDSGIALHDLDHAAAQLNGNVNGYHKLNRSSSRGGRKSRRQRTRTGISVKEVPVQWQEVGGSKLNVVKDSLGMAWGLIILRAGWKAGVYQRR